jgi:hypothetical protein
VRGHARVARISSSIIHKLQTVRDEMSRGARGPEQSTGIMFLCGTDCGDVGSVRPLEVLRAADVRVNATTQRVKGDGCPVFRITPLGAASSVDLIASTQVIDAVIELRTRPILSGLPYSIEVAPAGDDATHGSIDILVQIPADTKDGTEVVLRSVSIAGCDVPLGEAFVRIIVGFNHSHAPRGQVFAAVEANNIPALSQALDDGCSTGACVFLVSPFFFPHSPTPTTLVQDGSTSLHWAARNAHIDAVRVMMEADAPASPVDEVRTSGKNG